MSPTPGQVRASTLYLAAWSPLALPWGDEDHQIVGAIAGRLLRPAVRQRVYALLAADADR